jgi:hypothetical protein
MHKSGNVARVVTVPLSGYINRLQAIASSSIIAAECNAQFGLCWTDINVTLAPIEEVFSADFVSEFVIDEINFREFVGIGPKEIPDYLNVNENIISLAGLDKGEQIFMSDLLELIEQSTKPVTLVFAAGGNFSFSTQEKAILQRGEWYRNFKFSDAIESQAKKLLTNRDPYIGVHLRYTDRAHESPLAKSIYNAIACQVELSGTDSVFIASDTEKIKDKWVRKLENAGFKPWTAQVELDGLSKTRTGIGALVDWKILGHACTSVYFAASSYGHEAAVMAGSIDTSVALKGHVIQRVRSRSTELVGSFVNYPKNHWFR